MWIPEHSDYEEIAVNGDDLRRVRAWDEPMPWNEVTEDDASAAQEDNALPSTTDYRRPRGRGIWGEEADDDGSDHSEAITTSDVLHAIETAGYDVTRHLGPATYRAPSGLTQSRIVQLKKRASARCGNRTGRYSDLRQADAVLELDPAHGVQNVNAFLQLVGQLLTAAERLPQLASHPELCDHPAVRSAQHLNLSDLDELALSAQRIVETARRHGLAFVRQLLASLRAGMTQLVETMRRADYLDSLRVWLGSWLAPLDVPRPVFARPRPPSAPLSPPV